MKQNVMITEQGDLGLGVTFFKQKDPKAERAAKQRKEEDAKKLKREKPKK